MISSYNQPIPSKFVYQVQLFLTFSDLVDATRVYPVDHTTCNKVAAVIYLA